MIEKASKRRCGAVAPGEFAIEYIRRDGASHGEYSEPPVTVGDAPA